jgi:oxygen-independent coproporphyrinogen III oxidase
MQITGSNELSIYFHFPFCFEKKCPYCHFYSESYKKDLCLEFLKSLKLHWQQNLNKLKNKKIVSIYFGGGSPGLLEEKDLLFIFDFMKKSNITIDKNCEITIELNPFFITRKKLKFYKEIGINRVSLGVQSFDDELLKVLGRKHTSKQAAKSVLACYESGLKNISIDIMYDVFYQTMPSFKKTFSIISDLPITHLSMYNLTIEPNTKFFLNKEKLSKHLPSEKSSLEFLNYAVSSLLALGFKRYEISAFSKNNQESNHNMGYWLGREYLGFGPSAHSYCNKKRYSSVSDLSAYIDLLSSDKDPTIFIEELKYPDNINELLVVNLRLVKGIDIKSFEKRFNLKIPQKTMVNLDVLVKEGLLSNKDDLYRLSKKGLLFYDHIASLLI